MRSPGRNPRWGGATGLECGTLLAPEERIGHTDLIDPVDRVAMISEATAVSFRQNLGDMLNQVQYRHDSILIKRDGKPVAALVDARLFERIRRLQARFDGLCERLEAGYAEVPEAEGLAEIDAAVAASRAGR
jgi:prevent-host-death family protein